MLQRLRNFDGDPFFFASSQIFGVFFFFFFFFSFFLFGLNAMVAWYYYHAMVEKARFGLPRPVALALAATRMQICLRQRH